MKLNIIGAGMAGSILAKLCRKEGIEFNLFDMEMTGRASIISENLIGKRWYKDQQNEVRQSLEILRSIVPVREIVGETPAWHVYTNDLLEKDYIKAEAIPLSDGTMVAYDEGCTEYTGINVICAGVWTRTITSLKVDSSVGHGLIFKGTHPESIKLFAPFRYRKIIQRNTDEIWFSDSLSVNEKSYQKDSQKYSTKLFEKAALFPNLTQGGVYKFGYRPITETHNNIKTSMGWVITGGNKSGMVYYPIQCKQLIELLKQQS